MGMMFKEGKDIYPSWSVEEDRKPYLVNWDPASFSRMIYPIIPILVANPIKTGQAITQWSAFWYT